MRISTNTIYDTSVANLQQQSSRLMQIQEQIGASRRILTPADDPSGSARVLEISQAQGISQQYDANIGAASDSLALEESVLASIGDLLQSAKDATNAAGNGSYNQSDRLTLASALRSQYQQLIGLANSTDTSGQFMFAGYRSATSPFKQTAPGVVAYNGDQGQRLLQVGPTRQIEVSDSGGGLFVNIPVGNGNFVTKAGSAVAPALVGAAPVPVFADIPANAFSINGVPIGTVSAGADAVTQGKNVSNAINNAINLLNAAAPGSSDVTAVSDLVTGAVTLTSPTGVDIVIAGVITGTGLTAASTAGANDGLTPNAVPGIAPAAVFAGIAANTFQINGLPVGAVTAGTDAITQGANVASAINLISTTSGVTAVSSGATGAVTLRSTSGTQIAVTGTLIGTGLSAVVAPGNANSGTGLIDGGTTLDAMKWNNALNSKDYTIQFSVDSKGATSYDIIDNATGNSWLTGAAPGAAPFPRSYTSGSAIQFSRAAVPAFDFGANVTILGAPASGDTFSISNGGTPGNIVPVASGTNSGTATIGAGAVTIPGSWGAGQNLSIKFDVSTEVPPVTTYDLIDNSTGKSALTGGTPAASGPYPRIFTSGNPINFSQSGLAALDFGAETTVSGAPKNGDSFAVKASASQDVFKTIADLASLLESAVGATTRTNELSRLQIDLTNALNNFIAARSSVGSRMKELDGLKNGNDSLALQYSQSLSRIQDLDYAKAASEFTQQQVTLQAAQQTFVKVAGLSLFNYL